MAKRGRKPKFKTVSELEKCIDEYFDECCKRGRPYTMTGLALALGFLTRKSLTDYEGKPEFVNTITRARARVEQYAEERLFDRDGARGAQFSLRYNFGWKDEDDKTAAAEPVVINISPRGGNDAGS